MNYLDTTTDMWDVQTGNNGSTCATSTDVVFIYQSPIQWPGGAGARGEAPCYRWLSGATCDQVWLFLDVGAISSDTSQHFNIQSPDHQPNYEVNLIKTIRHEIGHSAALAHSGVLCNYSNCSSVQPDYVDSMVSGWVPTDLLWTTYNQHHRDEINFLY